MDPRLFYYFASILPLGIAAQWLAWRFRLPSILLLLGFGFLLGMVWDVDELLIETMRTDSAAAHHSDDHADEDGAEEKDDADQHAAPSFDPQRLLFPFISLAVAVILFEGGMTLRLSELREAGRSVLMLCTVGAVITWILASLTGIWVLGFTWQIAALLGAVLVVTGPTVIAPLLRHVRPNRRVGSVAKWEGIVIDPIGAVLAVLVLIAVIQSANTQAAVLGVTWAIIKTIVVGLVLGLLAGWVLMLALKRFMVPDFLHNVFFLATVLGMFALSNHLQAESGLLTVTVMGIFLANQKRVGLKHVQQFKESLQVLLISTLFIVLASRINLPDLTGVGWQGLLFLAVLILVIRPISVFASLIGSELNLRERTFLAFLAPRGIVAAAVSSIFALEVALHAGHAVGIPPQIVADAEKIVPMTFVVIVGTVAIYGLAAGPIARLLGLASANPQGVLIAGASDWAIELAKVLKEEEIAVLMVDTNYDHTAKARMAGIPCVAASILSEYVQESLDLGGIGRMLALTANDEVNALAAQEMSHLFGSAEVYQLAPWDAQQGRRTSVSEHLQGRLLFDEECTYAFLAGHINRGYQLKRTSITDEFTFDDYRLLYGEEAIPMFLFRDGGQMMVITAEEPIAPTSGQRLVSLVPPEQVIAPRRERLEAERAAQREAEKQAQAEAEAEAESQAEQDGDEPAAEE